MRKLDNAAALLDEVRGRGCTLFGCGFVAGEFYRALELHGVEGGIRGCVASDPAPGREFHGMPVLPLRQADPAAMGLVCVAVHEANLPAVAAALERAGVDDAVWVYPHLHGLLYGSPIVSGARVSLRAILRAQDAQARWLSVRALAARALREGGEDVEALDAYVRAQALHCGGQTARRRLEQLRELVESFAARGFDGGHPVLLDARLQVIDGLHRIALAWLSGMDHVPCDIVAPSAEYDRMLGEANRLTPRVLDGAGLSPAQRARIEDMHAALAGGTGKAKPEISVIVPVHDVEGYLDQCLESVVGQTFGDFEVLLVDDGSADGSAVACDAWMRRDGRIACLHKPNAGVSSSRNLGIQMARGKYLAFVDPDDWLDARYLEKLHAAAEESDALYAECDLWRYDNRTGKAAYRSCGQRMGVPYTYLEHMKFSPTGSYKAISRRSLWVENDVRFPACAFESPAIHALVLALAGQRRAYVPEALYWYRRFRPDSLVETGYANKAGAPDDTLGVDAMAHLCAEFRRRGLWDGHAQAMPGIVTWRLNDILALQHHRRAPGEFARLLQNQRAYLEREFPGMPNGAYLTWGGYNLSRVLRHLPLLHDPSCVFSFSSLAAVALGAPLDAAVDHPNRYRKMMVERELRQDFWEVLRREKPSFLFMDLLEERFDMLDVGGGRYITCSDAYEGAQVGMASVRRVPFGSAEHRQLWEEALDAFAQRISREAPQMRVVLVENLLSERVGDLGQTREFPDVGRIRRVNEELRERYARAQAVLPGAVAVRAWECEGYFTDARYDYGAVPQHLNDLVNERIAGFVDEAVRHTGEVPDED